MVIRSVPVTGRYRITGRAHRPVGYLSHERLQTKTKEFTRLTHTGLVVELEQLEIETRLIDEKFANAMGEYVT